ncbi:MAG: hypothetical protein IT324_01380 [Anaerolineae bacterium]|nr:hypothetical protein [Anaerolineae bacterium]
MTDLPAENTTPEITEAPAETLPPLRTFDELSLAEVAGQLLWHPRRTWLELMDTLSRLPEPPADLTAESTDALDSLRPRSAYRPALAADVPVSVLPRVDLSAIDWKMLAPLIGMGVALLVALIGALIVPTGRNTVINLPDGTVVPNRTSLWIGGLLMLAASAGLAVIAARTLTLPRLEPLETPARPARAGDRSMLSLRIALMAVATLWTLGSWLFNVDNSFTPMGIFCWLISIITWTVALLDRDSSPMMWLTRQRERVSDLFHKPISFRLSWTPLLLLIILIIGAWFRFGGLADYPPDMTSDHVEKALDSFRVLEGNRSIFFPNNGGREGFQMYYLALLKMATGIPVNFEWLKLGSGLEGMLSLVLLWWMGRAIIGEEDRALGNLVGLLMAAMAATSYWHILVSRLGLRIILTPLITTVVFVYLSRALRHNRRSDYLITGLALGASMYMYQADRMLPLVVIAGIVLALIVRVRRRIETRRYLLNLLALAIVALVVFVPLGHYMAQYPESFWQRTAGRLFGDDTTRDPSTGEVIQLDLTLADRLEAFRKNVPFLVDNLAASLLMFNYRGHASFFDGASEGFPALDFFSGALFALGLGLVIWRIIRRRDPVDWLLPVALIILVLPGALAIAYTVEVPSFTRSSGTLPIVYLIAALPLALLLREVYRRITWNRLRYGILAGVVVLFILGAASNANAYFVGAMDDYRDSTLPHRQAGRIMQGFINSTGAPGNAFVVDFDYWWDYRALGIEAGDPHWANIVWRNPSYKESLIQLIQKNMRTAYEFRPDREALFFVEPSHIVMLDLLREVFPKGTVIKVPSFKPSRDFLMYTVPPVGCAWMQTNIGESPASCAQDAAPDSEATTPTPEDVSITPVPR